MTSREITELTVKQHGHVEEYAKWAAKRDNARTDLITKRLFQLRKPLLT